MPDTEKYLNTPSRGREDDNKLGWKLGDIVHTAGGYVTANGYGYCGYEEFKIPVGSRARLIGIKQTDLNASYHKDGVGDVYIDFELVDLTNPDGTPITCGNRHSASMIEASPNFALCPDGSGEPGFIREHREHEEGTKWWFSLHAKQIEDHPVHGYVQYLNRKVVDPVTKKEVDARLFV